MLHRGDLHGLLADAVRRLKPDAIKFGRRASTSINPTSMSTCVSRAAKRRVPRSCIGADGIHSKVRECLFGPDRPEFTGCVAWRGLVPMERLPAHIARMLGTNWLGPRGHVLHYPVRRGELMNFISFVERDDWQVESWTVAGTTAELANDFRGWHPDVHAIIGNIEAPFKWAMMVRARWMLDQGTHQLLGDACHPTLPFLGQGAVMAIEDAYVVAACLEKYFDDPAAAFARYEDDPPGPHRHGRPQIARE